MINLLNNGKVIIQIEDMYYEFISKKSLAKNAGIISRFRLYNVDDKFTDNISYSLEDKYIYYDNDTDNIYMWTNVDQNNNISEKIIWYQWNNNTFEKLEGIRYESIIAKYNNNKLKLLQDIYNMYNKDSSESDKEVDITSTEEDDDDSDFIIEDIDEYESEDESIPIEEEEQKETDKNEIVNNYMNYMMSNGVEIRTEYVNHLIHVAKSTSELDMDKFNMVLDYLYNYYLI